MQGKERDRAEVTGLRQGARLPDALAILKKVSRHYRVAIARLRRRSGCGLRARDIAMWLVWEQCGMSLREIGDFFGGLNYAAIAQRAPPPHLGGQARGSQAAFKMSKT